MRAVAVMLASVVFAGVAAASTAPVFTRLPRPGFPPPASVVQPGWAKLRLVSSRYHSPAAPIRSLPDPPEWAPRTFRGEELQLAIRQPQSALVFLVYGRDGSSGRYLVSANTRSRQLRYAFDFASFAHAPADGEFEQVLWAREAEGVLYVETAHLTYASATRGRNAYVSTIDLTKRKTLWRSPALVANASTFVVTAGVVAAGYGFTSEDDFLYLLDRANGRVLDRLALPTAPEVIRVHGDRILVRTYDHDVVARVTG